MGTKIQNIYIVYDVVEKTELEVLTGINIVDNVVKFPHAVSLANTSARLTIAEMNSIVFEQ